MAAPASLDSFNPISLQDILGGNQSDLFGQFNMDPKGNNEVGAQMRRIVQAIFPIIAQRLVEMGKIQPAVNQGIEQTAQALSPEGTQNLYNEQNATLQRQGQQEGDYNAAQLKGAGLSTAAQEGARLAAGNKATMSSNDYLNSLFSPEQIAQRSSQLAGFQSGLSSDLLGQLLNAGGFIEQRHAANQAEQNAGGLNGVLGQLGGIASMVPGAQWASIFKGLGGAHSGSTSGTSTGSAGGLMAGQQF